MATRVSPADPIFYAHHANVDKQWDDWQKIGQNQRSYSGNVTENMAPFGYPPSDILDSSGIGVCYQGASSKREDSWVDELNNLSYEELMRIPRCKPKGSVVDSIEYVTMMGWNYTEIIDQLYLENKYSQYAPFEYNRGFDENIAKQVIQDHYSIKNNGGSV